MEKFNGYKFVGLTEEDNNAILEAVENEVELFMNGNKVFTEGGTYLADVKEVEEGNGVLC